MKFGVIVFPGSNCVHDAYHVISKHVGQPVDFIWHRETDLSTYDAVIIPGGFSYGDYLRAGARSEEHTSELQSLAYLVCRLLLEKKKKKKKMTTKSYTTKLINK